MTRTEYLFACLAEECAEVQKECAKILRFGLGSHHPDETVTNVDKLSLEIIDVAAIVDMLVRDNLLALPDIGTQDELIDKKKEKVEKYMEYSRKSGALHD